MCQAVICLALVLCVLFFGGGGNRLYWATSSWLLSILRISSSSLSPSCMNKLFMASLKPSLWSLFLPLWMLMHCKYDVTSTGIHSALVSFSLLIVVRHTGTRTWVYEWVSPHHRFNVILVKELRLSDYRVEDAATAGKDEATMKKPLIPSDFFYSTHFCHLWSGSSFSQWQ